MHIVWIVSRDGEVTVAHHLLGDVDGEGSVNTGPVWLRHFLWRTDVKNELVLGKHILIL